MKYLLSSTRAFTHSFLTFYLSCQIIWKIQDSSKLSYHYSILYFFFIFFFFIFILKHHVLESGMGRRITIFNGVHRYFRRPWQRVEISVYRLWKRRRCFPNTLHYRFDIRRETFLFFGSSSRPIYQQIMREDVGHGTSHERWLMANRISKFILIIFKTILPLIYLIRFWKKLF